MSSQADFEEQEPGLDSLRAALEASSRRERELGASLIEAQDRLLQAEDELVEMRRELAAAGQGADALRAVVDSVRRELARRDQLLLAETARREYLENVPAVRLLYRLRDLPGMGWLRRRGAKVYQRALASARGSPDESDP